MTNSNSPVDSSRSAGSTAVSLVHLEPLFNQAQFEHGGFFRVRIDEQHLITIRQQALPSSLHP